MSKKIIATIFLIVMILTMTGAFLAPSKAMAQAPGTGTAAVVGGLIAGGSGALTAGVAYNSAFGGAIDNYAAVIGNLVLRAAAWFLSLVGVILNISIILTLNIKAIYEATPAIEQVWVVIRNLSSIFIIFALIYTSILTILDQGGPKLGTLVKNIVIAGLLINFSLFFTKLAIDASNLISLQFYRAIAPESQTASITKDTIGDVLKKSFTDGGISNVFMQSLQIPKVYDPKTQKSLLQDEQGGAMFKIFVSTVAGSGLMFFAALSFLAAAIAFTIRLVILLLLMGFSPIYFVGIIFPDVKKDVSNKWFGWLKQQLIFMPVYLLFMYVALRFISTINAGDASKGFFAALGDAQSKLKGDTGQGGIILSNIGIIFQYTIAFILINIPLFAAVQVGGGLSTKWGEGAKNWVSGKLSGWAKSGAVGIGSFAGRNTLGSAASRFSDSAAMRTLGANSPFLGRIAQGGLSKVSGASFGGKKGGYDAVVKADRKAMEALDKKIGTVNRYDYKTDQEFKAAKDAAEEYQKAYRQNLGSQSLINRVINGRAGQASAAKLIKDASKEAAKKNKGTNEKKLAEKQKRVDEIDEKLKNPTEGVGFGQRTMSQSEIDRLKKERSDAKEEMTKLSKEIEDAKGAERDDLIAEIAEKAKPEGGGRRKMREEVKKLKNKDEIHQRTS